MCRPFHIHGLSQESSGMFVSQMTTDMFNLSINELYNNYQVQY